MVSRPGVRMGVDVGSVRIGVARSDPGAVLATPLETVHRPGIPDGSDLARLAELVRNHAVTEVVVGLPLGLRGEEGAAARAARQYAVALAAVVRPVRVRVVDERLTTVDAHRRLRESGLPGRAQRHVVDQAAAVLILQGALDAERESGRPAGELVMARRLKHREPRKEDRHG